MSHRPARSVVMGALLVAASGCNLHRGAGHPAVAVVAPMGGRLSIAVEAPGSLDPANLTSSAAKLIDSLICEPLISLDPQSGLPRPSLATSYVIAQRGKSLTVSIRKGARFSDGEPVTARDVVFSLSRIAGIDYGSPNAALLNRVEGYPIIHGDRPTTKRTNATRELSGVQVVSTSAVSISLHTADAEFVRTLALGFSAPVSRKAAARNPDTFGQEPICSGPYKMTRPYRPGDATIVLTRTPRYSGNNTAFTNRGRGYPETVVFDIVADRQTGVRAFAADKVDIATLPADSNLRPAVGTTIVSAANPALDLVGLPLTIAPYDNVLVRRALSQAINRSAIAQHVLKGARLPANGLLPQTLRSSDSAGCGSATPIDGDTQAAVATLASSGISLRGRSLKFYFNDELGNRPTVDAVSKVWKSTFGLQVQPIPMTWPAYLSKAQASGGFDGAFRESWSAQPESDSAFFRPLFSSASAALENFARYRSETFDSLITDRVDKQANDAERAIAQAQLEQQLCEDLPLIPVTNGASRYLIRTSAIGSAIASFTDKATGLLALHELFIAHQRQATP